MNLKTTIIVLTLITSLIWSCASNLYTEGNVYKQYGLFNQNKQKDEKVEYRLVWENIVWGTVFFKTIAAPIYFFGFSLWEPIRVKEAAKEKEKNNET